MRCKEMVRVNGDLVNSFLYKNRITQREFSKKLHYSDSWWSVVRKKDYIIPKRTAILMADMFGFAWSDLVGEGVPEMVEPPKVEAGDNFRDFVVLLQNIDKKLNRIEEQLNGLEWLHK